MSDVVFLGSEVPSNRLILESQGVTRFGFSFEAARRRGFPKTKPFSFDAFGPDAEIYVYPGVSPEQAGSVADLTAFAADYQDFVVSHLDRITAFTEYDSWVLGATWVAQQRRFWSDVDDVKFWPVWHERDGFQALDMLAQQYENVALPHGTIEAVTSLAGRTQALTNRYGTKWHALATAKPDNLRSIRFTTASTMSWLSPMRRGETILWDGTRIQRYPKKMKDQARMRAHQVAERAGLDADLVKADDNKEVARLAVWSYLQLEKSMERRPPFTLIPGGDDVEPVLVDNNVDRDDPGDAELSGSYPDNSLVVPGTPGEVGQRAPVVVRDEDEMMSMPVMGFDLMEIVDKDEDGKDVIRQAPVARATTRSLRQCDTCFVAANCPAFKPANTCAFDLPVSIATKDQFKALLTTVIEMQAARVAFARYAEELNGGYPDPNTSNEMDRLFKMSKTLKEMDENREFARITVERQTSGGILSAIFGDRAQALRELPSGPVNPDAIIEGALGDPAK